MSYIQPKPTSSQWSDVAALTALLTLLFMAPALYDLLQWLGQ
jgi:hypothetical protein